MKSTTVTVAVLVMGFGVVGTRDAHAGRTATGACMLRDHHVEVVTYWQRGPAFDHHDERCDNPGDCRLQGWLVAPTTGTNLRAIVLEHGSAGGLPSGDQQDLGMYCEMIDYFVQRHFVVLMPFRRGVKDCTQFYMVGSNPVPAGGGAVCADGITQGYFKNTGWAAGDWSKLMAHAYPAPQASVSWNLTYLEWEAWDIEDAINWLFGVRRNGTNLIAPSRLALMGHSMGGVLMTIASNVPFTHRPQAVVNLSGAGMTWHQSHFYPEEQIVFAQESLYPMLFQRVLNESYDGNDGPTTSACTFQTPLIQPDFDSAVLQANALNAAGGEARLALYPPITLTCQELAVCAASSPPTPNYWCAHANFIISPNYVPIWIGRVEQFLANHGL